MKILTVLVLLLILIGIIVYSSAQNSNVTVNVSLTPQQYSNIMTIAANRGLTVEQFLTETNNGLVIAARRQAIEARMRAAFDKFNSLTDAQKDRVLDLIESF